MTTKVNGDIQATWTAFKQDQSNQELRNRLIERYFPLVRFNADPGPGLDLGVDDVRVDGVGADCPGEGADRAATRLAEERGHEHRLVVAPDPDLVDPLPDALGELRHRHAVVVLLPDQALEVGQDGLPRLPHVQVEGRHRPPEALHQPQALHGDSR